MADEQRLPAILLGRPEIERELSGIRKAPVLLLFFPAESLPVVFVHLPATAA
jgi:hypothetical protein